MEEKISVIIPVYKVEKYLSCCVQSVINQTYKNLEIILVDDGSPDNCPSLCDDFAKKDSRIKVIHQKNGGLSSARNSGIEIATGEYISFVDSDDTIHPQMYEVLSNAIKQTDAEISMASWKKVYDIAKPDNENYNPSTITSQIYKDNEVIDLLFNKKVPLIMAAWSKLYKADLFKDVKYPVGKIHEDEFVIHKLLSKTKTLAYINLPLYVNTQRDDSITAQRNFSIKRLDYLEARKDRWEFCKNNFLSFEQKALSQYLISIASIYAKFKKYSNDKQILINLSKEFKTNYPLLKHKNKYVLLFKFSKPLYCFLYFLR